MAPGSGRDFNCSWEHCGKSFNRKSDLCRHFRIHTNERPYHCTVQDCNKSFIQRSALTVHSRTHTGEKPHVCDQESCHKAFSDSSSLARHRRIHTGKRPYICQEPTCERSFCRKTTLTKHQHRSHPSGTMTRPQSEDTISEQSYQTPIAVSIPNDQYLLAQQPYYPQSGTPTHDFYPQQNLPITPVVPEPPPPLVTQNVPVSPHLEIQQVQQQYLQLMQQRYEQQNRPNYVPPEFHHHHHHHQHQQQQQQQQQQSFGPNPMAEAQPLMMSYLPNYQYKPPSRILNQPEGTDWGFLGVG